MQRLLCFLAWLRRFVSKRLHNPSPQSYLNQCKTRWMNLLEALTK